MAKTKTITTVVEEKGSVVSLKQLIALADRITDSTAGETGFKVSKAKLTGRFALAVFTGAHEGLDVSYKALKAGLTETQLKSVKGAASKANSLHGYLKAGNNLTIPATETAPSKVVDIVDILDGTVTISTAYSVMASAKKTVAETMKLKTASAIEEVQAYLEGGQGKVEHFNIPADTLTEMLGLDGTLAEVREMGRVKLAERTAVQALADKKQAIKDAIAFLTENGYEVHLAVLK
jgi:hypothetical protein